ncbi:DNA repair protein RecN [Anaerovorax odorimutans]|uniref:DNA repair protein RecN n=1 Tax=Anaerovorax odorimutans TaxID=109327 RepID=A0ABT1RQB8_9FIRM|nr:DNA repair protein RecN [Anaerovorax odorimutans]MCQ4637359.1 DNA repair protein RecN [Anaerovorax odorimutans]
MISHISIRDFAIIENVEIDFHEGLNIITGETGAGKSIVIEAVSLALGSRADTAFVRSGKEKAIVQLAGTHKGEEYVITREVSAAGKNLCKINGEIVTLGHLNLLCKKLADIHGQYDHQSLLNPDYHIKLVDMYKKDTIGPAKQKVAAIFSQYREVSGKLKQLIADAAENQRKRDFMVFELEEIRKAELTAGEDDALEEEINVLQNSEKIYENLAGAYELANGEEFPALGGMKKAMDMIGQIGEYSKELSDIHQQMSEAYYTFEELCSQIRDCRDRTVFSPEDLDRSIARMETLTALKRKHNASLEEIIAYGDTLEEKLAQVENIDSLKAELTALREKCEADLKDACQELSKLRREAASELEEKILYELAELNFKDAQLSIEFKESAEYTDSGTDIVEFLISTNKGEKLKPLSKIASGGEMSRIMLAFKKIVGDYDEIPTMIFDEIDAGISGITASIVGRKLRQIAENHQIICITHLPQIAAFGSHNYKIYKESDESNTYTTVIQLHPDEKIQEIARLLGGINITDTTLESAKELVEASE